MSGPATCEHDAVIPIIYGIFVVAKANAMIDFVPGGCIFDCDSPRWFCRSCGHEFRRLDDDDEEA